MNFRQSFRLLIARVLLATALPAFASYPGKNGKIAFINGPDVYTMNPDGSNVKQLTDLGTNNGAYFESWSPDGKQNRLHRISSSGFRGSTLDHECRRKQPAPDLSRS
jgi:hypothetical protein